MQFNWIQNRRNKCSDAPCLEKLYRDRIKELDYIRQCRIRPFDHLGSFEGKFIETILADEILGLRIKLLPFEGWTDLLVSNLQVSGGGMVRKDGSLVIEGLCPHLGTMEDAILEIEPDGHISAAIHTRNKDSNIFAAVDGKNVSGSVVLYFTNNTTRAERPDSMTDGFAGWVDKNNSESLPLSPMSRP